MTRKYINSGEFEKQRMFHTGKDPHTAGLTAKNYFIAGGLKNYGGEGGIRTPVRILS
jgi:hypothetical protein